MKILLRPLLLLLAGLFIMGARLAENLQAAAAPNQPAPLAQHPRPLPTAGTPARTYESATTNALATQKGWFGEKYLTVNF